MGELFLTADALKKKNQKKGRTVAPSSQGGGEKSEKGDKDVLTPNPKEEKRKTLRLSRISD